jgi:hypothetical protein
MELRRRVRASVSNEARPTNLEVFKILVELAEKESDRMWTRYTVMLYCNTALMAALSAAVALRSPWATLGPSIIGTVVTTAWIQIHRMSYFHQNRWIADMVALADEEPILARYIRGHTNPRVKPPLKEIKALALSVPAAFMAVWFSAACVSIVFIAT